MTGINQKVFLRALSWFWDYGNRQRIGGDMTEWSLWQSLVEAEYIASANATKEVVWLWTLLWELDLPQPKATIIHTDNQGSIALAHNPVLHSRAKHIDIWYHFIWERVDRGEVSLNYVSTKEMMADIFTKALLCKSFEKFRTNFGVLYAIFVLVNKHWWHQINYI